MLYKIFMNSNEKNLLLETLVKGREDEMIERYIVDGPSQLKADLALNEDQWRVVFDALVFDHNMLYRCVAGNAEFFVDIYVKHGFTHVREVLDTVDEKYNTVLAMIFDLIAISHDGLFNHVLYHRERYMTAFRTHGSDFLRKILGIWHERYNEYWMRVLDFMLKTVCDNLFSQQTYDHGLKAFAEIFSRGRVHRAIFHSKLI